MTYAYGKMCKIEDANLQFNFFDSSGLFACPKRGKSRLREKIIPSLDTQITNFAYLCSRFRGVAQLVAHLVWDQVVARSSRVTPTNKSRDR